MRKVKKHSEVVFTALVVFLLFGAIYSNNNAAKAQTSGQEEGEEKHDVGSKQEKKEDKDKSSDGKQEQKDKEKNDDRDNDKKDEDDEDKDDNTPLEFEVPLPFP